MVGAGLETFPWRQPACASDMHIFLADHVSSLVWTQKKFWERGLPKPGNLSFVPLDIDDSRLGDRLSEFGFRKEPAFCSALGVTQYLERASVEALLRFAASLGRGSEIVFSYVPPAEDLEGADRDLPRRRQRAPPGSASLGRRGSAQTNCTAVACGWLRRGIAPHPGARTAALFCGARRWTASGQLGAIDDSGGVVLRMDGHSSLEGQL